MDKTKFIKLFYLIIIASLEHTICKDDVLVKSCPVDKANWDTAARRKECKPDGSKNYVYHCLKNEGQQLVETCLVAQWIEIGVCPVLFIGGNFGFENCTLIMLRTGGACPKTAYRSNELFSFPICFEILPKTTMTQLNTGTELMTVTVDVTSVTSEEGNTSRPGLLQALLTVLSLIIFAVVVFVLLYIYREKHGALPNTCNIKFCKDVEQGQEMTEENVSMFQTEQSTPQSAKEIVHLAAFDEGLRGLKEYGILIITGQIGIGKTTAMEKIIQLLTVEEKDLRVKDISSFRKVHSSDDKILIKWDDCFGKFVINPAKKENTKERLTEIFQWIKKRNENRKLIITMTNKEFEKSNVDELFQVEEDLVINEEGLLQSEGQATYSKMCLDNKVWEGQKVSLIDCIFKDVCGSKGCSDSHLEEIRRELMDETESVTFGLLGWPLVCRLAAVPDIATDIKSFKKDPGRCVMSLFDTLKSTNQQLYCAMIYVLFKGSNTNICRIDFAFLREIHEKLASEKDKEDLMGTDKSESTDDQGKILSHQLEEIFLTHSHYFVTKDNKCFEFHHEMFVLWLLCHFYQSFPEMTIKHFELDVLIELLRPNNYIVEGNEHDIGMLCSITVKNNGPKEHSVVEKYGTLAELAKGDRDKKPVQCDEDIEQRVHFKTGIETTSMDMSNQPEEGSSENQSWKLTLQPDLFSCFIKRFEKHKVEVQNLLVEKEKKYGMLDGHPLLEDSAFMRIYSPEEAVSKVQSKGKP